MPLRQCAGKCGKMILARYDYCGDPCVAPPDDDEEEYAEPLMVDVEDDNATGPVEKDDETLDFGQDDSE